MLRADLALQLAACFWARGRVREDHWIRAAPFPTSFWASWQGHTQLATLSGWSLDEQLLFRVSWS